MHLRIPAAVVAGLMACQAAFPAAAPAEQTRSSTTQVAVRTGDRLEVRTVEKPSPAQGEVLVRVMAAGVNAVDWRAPGTPAPGAAAAMAPAEGELPALAAPSMGPPIPGFDAAGVVEAVGPGVTGWRVGDEVIFYSPREGAYARDRVVPVTALATKPKNITFEEAAGMPTSAIMAWRLLVDVGKVSMNQRVLVYLGSGPLGYYAIQIARARGAQVIAVAPRRQRSYLLAINTDVYLDVDEGPFESRIRNIDLVFNAGDPSVVSRAVDVVKPGGMILSPVSVIDTAKADAAGVKVGTWTDDGTSPYQIVRQVASMIDRNQVDVHIEKVFPLSQANEAWDLAKQPGVSGHVILGMP